MRISDWISDVCSSDLHDQEAGTRQRAGERHHALVVLACRCKAWNQQQGAAVPLTRVVEIGDVGPAVDAVALGAARWLRCLLLQRGGGAGGIDVLEQARRLPALGDRKSTRLNSSH